MKLYRAVCDAEFSQVLRTRRLETIPQSLEGKWFAETIENARAWGHWFSGISGMNHARIVVVDIPDAMAARLFRLDRLDDIGPARFVSLDELDLITIDEITI